jgi:Kef-type K+ transport system membrane component KefB
METFYAPSHHDVLVLVIQIAVLLFVARAFGELAQRVKQPAVIGEILAGIVLGPSLLSSLVPVVGHWLVPQTEVQGYLLEVVSLIGVMFLLLITGLETDIALIRRHARTSLSAAAGGLVVPFATGFALGIYLPDFLLVNPEERLVFALFLAAAMSISAIAVIAKVLIDMDLMRRDIGQAIIAAGMVDDTTAWIVLSIIIGLAAGEAVTAFTVLQSVGLVLAFLIISFTAGRWLVKKALDFVQDEVISENRLLSLIVIMMFAWGAITQAINLEALFGAFIMGILFGQMPRLPKSVVHKLESITMGIFAPIFFAVAGLKVNLLSLADPTLLGIALLVLLIASFGKVVGAYAGARVLGNQDNWTALSFGAALNARGAMEIIIASIGLSLGVLTQDMFSIIVLMAMATSLVAPPALRWTLKRVQPQDEELRRLQREKLAEGSLVAGIHRILLPMRQRLDKGSPVQTIEARLLEKMGEKNDLSITLLNVAQTGKRAEGLAFLNELNGYFRRQEIVRKVVESSDSAQAILAEARKDYDLLVMGASEEKRPDNAMFTPLVDYVVRFAPCPTVVVHGPRSQPDWAPKRILVPTNGSAAARSAAELGFALASNGDEQVTLLNVVLQSQGLYPQDMSDGINQRRIATGQQIVKKLCELGHSMDVTTQAEVRTGLHPEKVILEMANKIGADLIILSTDLRPGSDRLFLGPRVEYILEQANCPVMILNIG